MNSEELEKNYDEIARWWTAQTEGSEYGLNYVRKAMDLAGKNAKVLDIGCGSTGRTIAEALRRNFEITGLDISAEMLRIARRKHPDVHFTKADFLSWKSPHRFDLIIAWDSLFHAARDLQEKLTRKMCRLLNKKGVLLFTAGGIEGETSGEMEGVRFDYGSLHYLEYLHIINDSGCRIVLLESDQYPEHHMVFICRKK